MHYLTHLKTIWINPFTLNCVFLHNFGEKVLVTGVIACKLVSWFFTTWQHLWKDLAAFSTWMWQCFKDGMGLFCVILYSLFCDYSFLATVLLGCRSFNSTACPNRTKSVSSYTAIQKQREQGYSIKLVFTACIEKKNWTESCWMRS